MKKNGLKIYVVAHKPCNLVSNDTYYPIQVNAEQNKHFLAITDDMGDNISKKNSRFCELTALYWIWKHDLNSQYIGLCHYRRYFKFKKGIKDYWKAIFEQSELNENEISIHNRILKILDDDYVIVPKKNKLDGRTVEEHYCKFHNADDLSTLKNIVLKKYPDYDAAWKITFSRKWMYAYNMFVMNRTLFQQYMEWLFDILFEVEKYVPPKTDAYQNRTFGFMSERLFNVFLEYQKCKVKELPIIFLT
jgi:hypothetical protein